MSRTEDLKRRISYTLLCVLFGFSLGVIFLSSVVNFGDAELRSKSASGIESQEKVLSGREDCVITDDQAIQDNSKNDTLFIGCNGFF